MPNWVTVMNVKNLFRSRQGSLDEEFGASGEEWSGQEPKEAPAEGGGQDLNRAFVDVEEHLATAVAEPVGDDDFVDLKAKFHARLVDQMDPGVLHRITPAEIEQYIHELIPIVLEEEGMALTARVRNRLVVEVLHEVTGYGPIQ